MVTIGSDSHKRTHTFVAVDDVGRRLSKRTVAATTEGHLEVLEWAERWPERRWALEDVYNYAEVPYPRPPAGPERDFATASEQCLRTLELRLPSYERPTCARARSVA